MNTANTYPGGDFYSHARMCERAGLVCKAARETMQAACERAKHRPTDVQASAAALVALEGLVAVRAMAEAVLGPGWERGEAVAPVLERGAS